MAERLNPGSFAINVPRQAPQARQAIGDTQARIGGVGVQSPGLTAMAPGVDTRGTSRTIDAITKLGGDALAPHIKRIAQEQYISGVQKAMTGEALGEILKDEPWYTQVFGPSAASQGARAYATQEAIARWAGDVERQMPELSKQPPEALREAAVGSLRGFLTGDPEADAAITAEVTTAMGPLFKQHAKQHVAWKQTEASTNQLRAWDAEGQLLQAAGANRVGGVGTDEDFKQAGDRFFQAIEPFEGQTDESYARNLTTTLETAASKGQFHVISAAQERGLLDAVSDPERRARLERAMATGGRRALIEQAMPKLAPKLAAEYLDFKKTPEERIAALEALNEEAAKLTGVPTDLATLVPRESYDNLSVSLLNQQAREAQQAAQERARAAAAQGRARAPTQEEKELALDQQAMAILSSGQGSSTTLGTLTSTSPLKRENLDRAGLQLWAQFGQAPNTAPAKRAEFLNKWHAESFPSIKANIQGVLQPTEALTPAYAAMAETMKRVQRPEDFLDSKQLQTMRFYQKQVDAGVLPEQAYQFARTWMPVAQGLPTSQEVSGVRATIRDHIQAEYDGGIFDTGDLTDKSKIVLEALVMREFDSLRGGVISSGEAANMAVRKALKSDSVEVLGKHLVLRATSGPATSAVAKHYSSEFSKTLEAKLKTAGFSGDPDVIIQLPDVIENGKIKQRRWTVSYTDDQGVEKVMPLTSDEITAAGSAGLSSKPKSAIPAPSWWPKLN